MPIMLAVVSWPAISRPVPSCAASFTLISPAVTRSARSDTASSAGFAIFVSTRLIRYLCRLIAPFWPSSALA